MGRGRHSKNGRHGPARSRRLPGLTGTVRVYDARAEVETAEGVYRLGSRSMREAMPGDRVYVSLHRGKGGARRAVVEHVIDRAVAAIVGVFEPAGPLGAVRPLDTRIKQDFFVLPADDSPRRLPHRSMRCSYAPSNEPCTNLITRATTPSALVRTAISPVRFADTPI